MQIVQLALFIVGDVPGEPSHGEGAVEVAIRLIRAHVPGVKEGANYAKVKFDGITTINGSDS